METPHPTDSLPWTGERLVTTSPRPLVYEHLHRYAIARSVALGKRVLDIACGEGYGSELLARVSAEVTGVDNDARAIAHASRKYERQNLRFVQGDCTDIPCVDGSIDLVVSFETIEHIEGQERFLSEIKRILVPGGLLIISSPDKGEYSASSAVANPFHRRELRHQEFSELLAAYFEHRLLGRQRLIAGSWIAPDAGQAAVAAATFKGGFDGISERPGVDRGLYSIGVCSDDPLPRITFGVWEDFSESADVWHMLGMYDSAANVAQVVAEGQQKARDLADTTVQMGELEKRHAAEALNTSIQMAELEKQYAAQALELLDTQWELLTLREASLRAATTPDDPAMRIAALETRAETACVERDQMRDMLKRLQGDLESARSDVENAHAELDTLKGEGTQSLAPHENLA